MEAEKGKKERRQRWMEGRMDGRRETGKKKDKKKVGFDLHTKRIKGLN